MENTSIGNGGQNNSLVVKIDGAVKEGCHTIPQQSGVQLQGQQQLGAGTDKSGQY
jgi:hypothetical protein